MEAWGVSFWICILASTISMLELRILGCAVFVLQLRNSHLSHPSSSSFSCLFYVHDQLFLGIHECWIISMPNACRTSQIQRRNVIVLRIPWRNQAEINEIMLLIIRNLLRWSVFSLLIVMWLNLRVLNLSEAISSVCKRQWWGWASGLQGNITTDLFY
jgi:hypothetical protein